MERYHDSRNDPLPIHSAQHNAERANLERLTAEFELRGGKIQEVGHKMSSAPATFTINPERSPVYAHLFAPVAAAKPAPPTTSTTRQVVAAKNPKSVHTEEHQVQQVALIMADAALGNSPKWIARKHHMTEKHVRQIARDYHITFHKQR